LLTRSIWLVCFSVAYISNDINCGVYIFSPAIFDDMRAVFVNNHESKEANPQMIWLERDVLSNMAGTGRLYMYKTGNFWSQVRLPFSPCRINLSSDGRRRCPRLVSHLTAGVFGWVA
jgi:hypothetical protein